MIQRTFLGLGIFRRLSDFNTLMVRYCWANDNQRRERWLCVKSRAVRAGRSLPWGAVKDVRETGVYRMFLIGAAVEPAMRGNSSMRLTGKPSRR